MHKKKIAVRVDQDLLEALEEVAQGLAQNESELIRQALREYLAKFRKQESCFELASRMGILKSKTALPKDLSTNKKYLEGFGL